ncbi:MAG TPA: hypothetical protein VGG16_13065 [Streptosporangiaceae bacterium]|jgi:hypothetical protein
MTTQRKIPVKYRTGVLLVGVGAYLAFAVSLHAAGFDPRSVGYVLIMAGVLTMALPHRPGHRARRGVLVRHYERPVTPPSKERWSGR